MRLLFILWFCNALNSCYPTKLGIRDEILREKSDWIEPGRDQRFQSEATVENDPVPPCEQPADVAELQKNLRISEKRLSQCEASLSKLQLAADLSGGWEVEPGLVYLRKLVIALLNRVERGSPARKGATAELHLRLSEKQRSEIKVFVDNLDHKTAAQLVERMQNIINQGFMSPDPEAPLNLGQQLYINLCSFVRGIDVFAAIQISIVVCAIILVYIAASCRSRFVTLSYLLVFGAWISYFWHWQNMLRKSQANRHLLIKKNPCEDSQSMYNPLRYFRTDSNDCEIYLRKTFTHMFWEFTPIEVLCDMVATYTSNVVSVLVVNIMTAVGDAIREFADKQSWFSIVPAFAVLLMILLILLFKISGYGLSLFYGAVRMAPSVQPASQERPRRQTISMYKDLHRSLDCRRCSSGRQIGWRVDHRTKKKKRNHRFLVGVETDSDGFLTAGEP